MVISLSTNEAEHFFHVFVNELFLHFEVPFGILVFSIYIKQILVYCICCEQFHICFAF